MIIAATGHRPDKLGGYSEEIFGALVGLALGYIDRQKELTHGISGMALGWDQAWAEALVRARVPFTAAVPFAGQEMRWPAESQQRYRRLLQKAERVEVIYLGSYSAWKMQGRNEWMVAHCDRMVALWNGTDGGTRNCLIYAEHKIGAGRIDNIWPFWETIAHNILGDYNGATEQGKGKARRA